ncbi:zinc ribbon domain-containing protein [Candidatus Solincola sp.]|nr:zinc ribbon domain-containing protein [Actinomycetota bacterium]
MRCPQCQAENPDDAQYCYLCYTRFGVRERSAEAEERARRLGEDNRGARLRCPNCGELSPVESPFCLRCGFVFEDIESLLVPEEQVRGYMEDKERRERLENEGLHSRPIPVEGDIDGVEVMRRVEDVLGGGYRARLQARGRQAIAHALKVLALLGEEMERKGKELILRVRLLDEQVVKDLEDLGLDIEAELVERSGGTE